MFFFLLFCSAIYHLFDPSNVFLRYYTSITKQKKKRIRLKLSLGSYMSFAIAIEVSHTCHVIIATRIWTDVVHTRDWCIKKKWTILNASLSTSAFFQYIAKFTTKFSCSRGEKKKVEKREKRDVSESEMLAIWTHSSE